jgi:crotonobetainyl-CoA:carnitine CoA-transferase CaiB-like acyl-CoA transferase
VFKTSDGHINIATTGTVIWERFCKAMDAPALLDNPDYKSSKLRSQHRKKLNAEIDTYTEKKSSAEWIDIFNKAGVPSGPIYSIDQVFADPQVQHLGIAQSTPKKDGSPLHVVGQPFTLSRTNSKIVARPPDLGEHTDEVLKEFGFSAGEIDALRRAKAV